MKIQNLILDYPLAILWFSGEECIILFSQKNLVRIATSNGLYVVTNSGSVNLFNIMILIILFFSLGNTWHSIFA